MKNLTSWINRWNIVFTLATSRDLGKLYIPWIWGDISLEPRRREPQKSVHTKTAPVTHAISHACWTLPRARDTLQYGMSLGLDSTVKFIFQKQVVFLKQPISGYRYVMKWWHRDQKCWHRASFASGTNSYVFPQCTREKSQWPEQLTDWSWYF